MAKGLTKRQRDILDYIIDCIRDNGCPPTILEIGAAFNITSTNAVSDHLLALEKKGFIERLSKARGIHVTQKAAVRLYNSGVAELPLVGRVAAGTPLLAEENIEDHVILSKQMAPPGGYCLRVKGDSMIEAGILDGDIIVVDRGRAPRMGDIVVALVENEATVKRFFPSGPIIELRPENASMQPFRYPASSVLIQGVVVGLQRRMN